MAEAKGTYKKETIYIIQIKSKITGFYRDNVTNKMLATDLNGLKDHAATFTGLDIRIIKRTVKEDLILRKKEDDERTI